MKNKTEKKNKQQPSQPVKPKQPNTEGMPDNKDPNAQYEDKDES